MALNGLRDAEDESGRCFDKLTAGFSFMDNGAISELSTF